MPQYRTSQKFKKVFEKKTKEMRAAILDCIKKLADNPRHPGLHTHKVQGAKGSVFEAYIDRGNRVTFHWEDGLIVLRNNCNHDVLKKP